MCRTHITDSSFFGKAYTTDEARRVFCDLQRAQRWLDVEAALAQAQGELGIIPEDAANEIASKAKLEYLDLNAIRKGIIETNHSLVPLLQAVQKECTEGKGEYIHYGATTQDIEDTGQVLEVRDALKIVRRDALKTISLLSGLASRYKDLVMLGRTHSQDALPMTLGLKFAVWLDEMERNIERLEAVEKRVLVSQLFGGVGSMDALGKDAFKVLELFSKKLGLRPPNTAWHASRDRFAELVSVLAILAGTLAKIADEIRCLAMSGIGELEEPFHLGKVGSSTMPHKRNPEMCEQVVVLFRLVKANVVTGMDAIINEHERDYRAVRLEWISVADSLLYTIGALNLANNILEGLIVHKDRINENLAKSAEMVCSEALMFLLGKKLGKQTAHHIIYEIAQKSFESGVSMKTLISKNPVVAKELSVEEIDRVFEPSSHIGMSREIIDNIVSKSNKRLTENVPSFFPCPMENENGSCRISNKKN